MSNKPPPSFLDSSILNIPEGLNTPRPSEPAVGSLTFDENENKILVYTDDGDHGPQWIPVAPASTWMTKHYIMRNRGGIVQGIFSAEVDTASPFDFTLYLPDHEAPFQPMTEEEIDASDYDTHVAFGTFPVLEERRASRNGILLQFPD